MTVSFLSIAGWLGGAAVLAGVLAVLQILRVRHRDVEVVTTLFWREAIERAHARVRWQRFRHWAAYLFVLALAWLLWTMVASPQRTSSDGLRTVILLDGAVARDDPAVFAAWCDAAIDVASEIPAALREVWLCDGTVRTVLAPGEPRAVMAERLRDFVPMDAPSVLERAVSMLDDLAAERAWRAIVIGDAPVRASLVELVTMNGAGTLERMPVDGATAPPATITALAVSEAASGAWDLVDVRIACADPGALRVTENDAPITLPPVDDDGAVILRDHPARGTVLVATCGATLRTVRVPDRRPLTVALAPTVPLALQSVVRADPMLDAVASDAQLTVGATDALTPGVRLTSSRGESAAIELLHPATFDANEVLQQWLGDLDLESFDAAAAAEALGREVRVVVRPVAADEAPQLRLWSELLTDQFDLVHARAFPLLVARAVRVIAERPPDVLGQSAGDPLPAARGPWQRVSETDPAADGPALDGVGAAVIPIVAGTYRDRHGVLVDVGAADAPPVGAAVETVASLPGRGINVVRWLGLLALLGLAIEWMLVGRGRMP